MPESQLLYLLMALSTVQPSGAMHRATPHQPAAHIVTSASDSQVALPIPLRPDSQRQESDGLSHDIRITEIRNTPR